MPGAKAVTRSITGEVVDMGCWLGHGARGEKHISCATKCLNQGMPVGLLTGNGTLYLVTLDHDNADLTRSGVKAIEASTVQLASK